MNVAPAIDIRDIPTGAAGVFATVGVMRQLARRASRAFTVRALAVAWTAGASTPLERADALRSRLAASFVYVDDPEAETIYAPEFLVREWAESGKIIGDCDDIATLGAALALAVGLAVRFVVVTFDAGGRFGVGVDHVYAEIRPAGANPLDPCAFDAGQTGGVELDLQRPPGPVQVARLVCIPV